MILIHNQDCLFRLRSEVKGKHITVFSSRMTQKEEKQRTKGLKIDTSSVDSSLVL